jgi:predicted dehydrogenase
MRWLVVGAGSIGRQHLAILRALGEHDLVVVEPNLATRKEAWEFVGKRNAVASMEDAPKYDVALICTPTDLHHAGAMAAAKARAHVIIEKPVHHVMDGANELIAATEGRLAVVACPMRFHLGMQKTKEAIDTGALGVVYYARQWYRQHMEDWRPGSDYRQSYSASKARGGGLLLDRIHELDAARWLFGEPKRIRAAMGATEYVESDTEHVVNALSIHGPSERIDGNMIDVLDLDCISRGYACGMHIVGTKDQLTLDYAPTVDGVPQMQGHADAMRKQTEHWRQCLYGVEEPQQTLVDAYKVLNTAMGAYASAGNGGAWANFVPQVPTPAVPLVPAVESPPPAPEPAAATAIDVTAIAARACP